MADIGFIVFGLTGLLALTSLLPALAQRVRLPYSVLLALAGSALGLLIAVGGDMPAGFVGTDFLDALSNFHISSQAFLVIFLPTLLFETALAIDVRRMLNDVAPILLMAVVAVVVCMVVVGITLSALTTYGLIACLMLGAIIATTDPAAVIGIFRDIGAPKRLTILVEGESLLNDAAAIAVFTILVAMLSGTAGDASAGGALLTFLKEFVGGLVLGFVLGRIACAILALFYNSELGHVSVTVALAYLAFVLGTYYLHVSGVVAVVAAALTLAAYGPTRVTPGAWRRIVETWHQLDFWANSL